MSHGELGLVVVGVTGEDATEVGNYVKANAVKHPIAVGYNEDYDVTGIPDAFLIDKDGKIVWRGHPAELDMPLVNRTLVGARPAIVPKDLAEVHALRKANDYGGAWRRTKELIDGGTLKAPALALAQQWVATTEQFVTESMAAADRPEVQKDLFLLWTKLEPVATGYQGVPGAERAKDRFAALMADPRTKKEVDAGQRLLAAQKLETDLEFDKAYEAFKVLASQAGSTRAGRLANDAYRRLEKEGKLGYQPACTYCKAKGGACPTHLRKKR